MCTNSFCRGGMVNYGTTSNYPEQIINLYNNQDRIDKLKILASKLETRKRDILTSFYLTGRIDGLYFGRASKSKRNHVKEYIKGCLYKNRIDDMSLIDDCYNTMFLELYKKPASQIVAMYDETPAKLLATALRIIALKCFGKDKRTNTPKHSLITTVLYTSITGGAVSIDRTEEYKETDNKVAHDDRPNEGNSMILHNDDTPEDFVLSYGFTPEDIIERMTPEERIAFYDILGKQPRGKTPASKLLTREALFSRIREIAKELK